MSHFEDCHAMCAVCGSENNNAYSLGVRFAPQNDNSVVSHFTVQSRHQGYSGLLHGGIASSLLDAAMTHCLFKHKITALTAQLDVRYHSPIKVGECVQVTGELLSVKRGVYFLKAGLTVADELRVSAGGKFIVSKTVG